MTVALVSSAGATRSLYGPKVGLILRHRRLTVSGYASTCIVRAIRLDLMETAAKLTRSSAVTPFTSGGCPGSRAVCQYASNHFKTRLLWLYSDAQVAYRHVRVWRGATENGH